MATKNSGADEDLLRKNVADFEKHVITSALMRTGGNRSEAAKQLGTTKRILIYRIQKYGINIEEFRIAGRKKDNHKESDI